MLIAQRQKSPVRIEDSVTADSVTVANPDGSFTLEQDAAPVRVKQADGSWADVDLSWQAVGGKVVEAMPVAPVTLSGGGDGLVAESVSTAGVADVRWGAALPTPVLSGTTATYPDVRPGVDLVVQAIRSGYELSFVVRQRPTTALTLPLTLDLKGMSAAVSSDGSMQVSDSTGKPLGRASTPVMFGAAVDPVSHMPSRQAAVRSTLSPATASNSPKPGSTAQSWTLTPDTTFLADPATAYPVTIDPTIAFNPSSDTWVKSDVSVSEYNNVDLWVGTPDAGATKARSYFHNNAIPSQLTGMYIDSANLGLYNVYSASCSLQPVTLYRMGSSSSWTSATTWSTKPAPDTSSSWSASFSNASNSCPGAGWSSIPITSLIQAWASGANVIRDWQISASETSTSGWKEFYSADAPDHIPYVSVTYRAYPSTPGNPTMTPVLGSGPSSYWTSTSTPTLSSTVASSTSSPVQGRFEIYQGSTLVWSGNGNSVTGSGTSKATVASTANLAQNTLYTVRVWGVSGGAQSKTWSNYIQFKTDTAAPTTPTITSTDFPSAVWTAGKTSGNFTVAATDTASGVDHYLWGLDSTSLTNSSASTTISISPMPGGWHTLYVAAVDKAGNRSSAAQYQFGSSSALTTPADGTVTQQSVALTSRGEPTHGVGQVTYYYRRADADSWLTPPVGDVSLTTSGPPAFSVWPYVYETTNDTTGVPASLTWNVKNTLSGVDGPVQVAVCFGSSTICPSSPGTTLPVGASTANGVTLDQKAFNVAETTSLPIGEANLLTGNYQISAGDVSVPGNQGESLSVGRTFNTVLATTSGSNGAPASGIFGPGWTASLPVASAGADWAALTDTGSVLTAVASDESTTQFAKTASGSFLPTGQDADSGMMIAADTTSAGCSPTADYYRCYDLTDLDGNTTVFRSVAGGTSASLPAAAGDVHTPVPYQMRKVVEPASLDTTSYTYTSGGLVTQILAPLPSSTAVCTNVSAASTWSPGCRGLGFAYNSSNEVTAVTYQTSDGTNPLQIDVACYAYDATTHQLTDEWDPRDIPAAASGSHPITCGTPVRPTHYHYDTSSRIDAVTPAYSSSSTPLVGWTIGYDSSGRVSTVTRTHTDGSGAEITRLLYGVPVTADPDPNHLAYRPDMTTTATWAQADNPDPSAGATAVCPPGSTATSSTADLGDCSLTYLDAAGQGVNTATYSGTGAAGWHISTTEHDAEGHVTRTLSPNDREEALAPTTGAGAALHLPADTAAAALELSTLNIYTPNLRDGQPDLTASFGPYHAVELPDGSIVDARAYTTTSYDNSTGDPFTSSGNEPGHPTGAGGALISYHLAVRTATSASIAPDTTPTTLTDTRTSDTKYYLGPDYTGWTYRTPMQTITDPGGLAITDTTLYDPPTGRVTYSRMPSAVADTTNTSAGATHTVYYTAAANSDDSSCGNKPMWDGLVCTTAAANLTPTSGLPSLITTKTTGYDYLQRSTGTDETSTTSPSSTRHTSTIYGFNSTITSGVSANPYATTAEQSATTGGVGSSVPAQTTTYDANTGLAASTSNGTIADQTLYDNFGRVTSYTENTSASGAAANTTTTSYDATHGWVTQTADAHTTQTYTYNGGNERRGLVTSKAVSVGGTSLGSFTATYDPSGSIATQTDPYGVTTTLTRDETDQLVVLDDVKAGSPWLTADSATPADQAAPSIFGQWREHDGPAGERSYTYDGTGRLTQAADSPANDVCTTRAYTYDSDSNRTASATYPATADGSCQASTGGVATSHNYDAADRLLSANGDTGLTYDAFGRITTTPAADVTGAADLAVDYYTNDLVHAQTQNGMAQTWTLDANGRLGGWTTAVGGTTTATKANHYDDASSDSPDWIAESAGSTQWTANVTDLIGSLAATVTQAGAATWQYADLHGDIVATATSSVASGAAVIGSDYTEFGANAGTSTRYGWLGGKRRSGDDLGGLTLMGVRLYNPALGRFLQTDPVDGGSANAYDYTDQDPVNSTDLDGRSTQPMGGGLINGMVLPVRAMLAATAAGALAYSGTGRVLANGLIVVGHRVVGCIWNRGCGAHSLDMAEHRKNARPSTTKKHQDGQARGRKDAGGDRGRGGEKGDARRRGNPNKRGGRWGGRGYSAD